MTNATLQTYKKIIGFPFAGSESGSGVYDIRQNGAYDTPASTVKAADVSLAHGFDAAYDVPVINGGSLLDTKIINSVLSLVSRDAAYRQAGGIYTFEQELSDIIGGYPEGAILQYLDANGTLHYLRSLVDNNTSNFLQGLDATKWAYCLPAETVRNLPLVDWGSNNAVRTTLYNINERSVTGGASGQWQDVNNANGTFTSSGYINIVNRGGTIKAGPDDFTLPPTGTYLTHTFCLCIGGNDLAYPIAQYSPDDIISGAVNGSCFDILLARKLIASPVNKYWWWTNGLLPVNAGTTWALKYKFTSSSLDFTSYQNSTALISANVNIDFQRMR